MSPTRPGDVPVIGSAADGVEARLMEPVVGVGFWKDAWRRFLKSPMAVTGALLIVLVALATLLAPALTPYGSEDQDLERQLQGPSLRHPFGTDLTGRDLLTRTLY